MEKHLKAESIHQMGFPKHLIKEFSILLENQEAYCQSSKLAEMRSTYLIDEFLECYSDINHLVGLKAVGDDIRKSVACKRVKLCDWYYDKQDINVNRILLDKLIKEIVKVSETVPVSSDIYTSAIQVCDSMFEIQNVSHCWMALNPASEQDMTLFSYVKHTVCYSESIPENSVLAGCKFVEGNDHYFYCPHIPKIMSPVVIGIKDCQPKRLQLTEHAFHCSNDCKKYYKLLRKEV